MFGNTVHSAIISLSQAMTKLDEDIGKSMNNLIEVDARLMRSDKVHEKYK